MGQRGDIRAAIVAYLIAHCDNAAIGGNGDIPFLNNVFGFPMAFTPEPAFYDPEVSSRTDGAIIWLYWPDQDDHRIEFGGTPGAQKGGTKQTTIVCNMDIIFKSSDPDMQVVGANNEAMIDGLVDVIRADRQANAPGVIYQWGEGERTSGDKDINVKSDYPIPISAGVAVVYSKAAVKVISILEQT